MILNFRQRNGAIAPGGLLLAFVGFASPGIIVPGPFCVAAAGVYIAGASVAQVYLAGSDSAQVYIAGSVAAQGDCL